MVIKLIKALNMLLVFLKKPFVILAKYLANNIMMKNRPVGIFSQFLTKHVFLNIADDVVLNTETF